MKTHELIKMCSNQIIDVINNRWGICREGNGSKYVNSPMPEKEYFTDMFEEDVQDDNRKLDDEKLISSSEYNQFIEAEKNRIEAAYDEMVIRRKEFLDSVDEFYEKFFEET